MASSNVTNFLKAFVHGNTAKASRFIKTALTQKQGAIIQRERAEPRVIVNQTQEN